VISADDFLWYVYEALNGMVDIVESLGDEGTNRRPDLPGANSAYAILCHCLGVMEYWGGQVVAGRTIERDRDAEFRATGSVADLVTRARKARAQLAEDMAGLDPSAAPRRPLAPDDPDAGLPIARTQGGALIHIYEELAQHRGQMELTRDVIRSTGVGA
jgi:hypothetical protein